MSVWDYLSNIISPGLPQLPQDFCTGGADAEAAKVRAKNGQILAAWKVQRLYYVADFARIYTEIYQQAGRLNNVAADAVTTLAGDTAGLRAQWGKLSDALVDGVFLANAYKAAVAEGKKVIDAPTLKTWATKVLEEMAMTQWWLTYTKCRQPALELALAWVGEALGVIWSIVAAVVEAVVEFAKDVYDVAAGAFKWLTYLKWAAIIGGTGFLAYKGHAAYKERFGDKALPRGDA